MELGDTAVARRLSALPESALAAYLQGRDRKELAFALAFEPPWELAALTPALLDCLRFDQVALPNQTQVRLSLVEQVLLRELALEIIGADTEPEQAAYAIFRWLCSKLRWGNSLGKTPSAILRDQKANHTQFALLFALLARSLFIPVRFVDELAHAPSERVRGLTGEWQGLPHPYHLWYGPNCWHHTWCEVFTGSGWVPCDPAAGQWGLDDLALHTRAPEVIKFGVRRYDERHDSYEDARAEYVFEPLRGAWGAEGNGLAEFAAASDALALPVDLPWHKCRELYIERTAEIERLPQLAAPLADGPGARLDDRHGCFWAPELAAPALAAVHGPLVTTGVGDVTEGNELVIFAPTAAFSELERETLHGWTQAGGRLTVYYGPGAAAQAAGGLLERFGVRFDESSLSGGPVTQSARVEVVGRPALTADGLQILFPAVLCDLLEPRLLLRLQGEGAPVGALVQAGRGTVFVAPAGLLTRANPYEQSYTSGSHRRLLRQILAAQRTL